MTNTDENNNDVLQNKENKTKENWIQILKYSLCAGSAGVIEAISFALLLWLLMIGKNQDQMPLINFLGTDMNWVQIVAQMVSLALSVIWNFTLNRKFTFKSDANVPKVLALAFAFYIPFYPASTLFVGWFSQWLTTKQAIILAAFLPKAIAMIANFVLEFIWQKFIVFKKKN